MADVDVVVQNSDIKACLRIASPAPSEFCEWVLVGIDVYIPLCKYQVKPHSSLWFSAACAAAIVRRNQFFICTNTINLLNLK